MSFPEKYPDFGLKTTLNQIKNLRNTTGEIDDPRLGLASQSIEAALHWLSQPPFKLPAKEPKHHDPEPPKTA